MHLCNMLDHVPLSHPSLGADTVASLLRTLEWGWMILSEVHREELFVTEGVVSGLVTAFSRTGEENRFVFGNVRNDVVITENVLAQVILAFEAIFTTIFATMKTWVSSHCVLVNFLVTNEIGHPGCLRAALGVATSVGGVQHFGSMIVKLGLRVECKVALCAIGVLWMVVFVMIKYAERSKKEFTAWKSAFDSLMSCIISMSQKQIKAREFLATISRRTPKGQMIKGAVMRAADLRIQDSVLLLREIQTRTTSGARATNVYCSLRSIFWLIHRNFWPSLRADVH